MPDDSEDRQQQRDRKLADLWQTVLRQELQHRKSLRTVLEQHEKVIGQKVRQLRTERGWTQEDLRRHLAELGWPLDQTTISNLELGRRPIRVGEAVALAAAFGLPLLALWYLPVAGEPSSLADMREALREMDESIARTEKTMHSIVTHYADQQSDRMRLVRAMNDAARAADNGELEIPDLSEETATALAEVLYKDKRKAAPGDPAIDALVALQQGVLEQLADEAFRLYQTGAGVDEVAGLISQSMPRNVLEDLQAQMIDPLSLAKQIVEQSILGTAPTGRPAAKPSSETQPDHR